MFLSGNLNKLRVLKKIFLPPTRHKVTSWGLPLFKNNQNAFFIYSMKKLLKKHDYLKDIILFYKKQNIKEIKMQ